MFLPESFRSPTVAASRDTIFVVDDDSPNNIYGYTNRFSGDQVTQNSLFRFVLGEDVEVFDLQEFDDQLYALVTIPGNTGMKYFYLLKMPLSPEEYNKPRIDLRTRFVINSNS